MTLKWSLLYSFGTKMASQVLKQKTSIKKIREPHTLSTGVYISVHSGHIKGRGQKGGEGKVKCFLWCLKR